MNLTPCHTQLFAHELTRRFPSDSADKLSGALVDAPVDLNPHQIDAARRRFSLPADIADDLLSHELLSAGLVPTGGSFESHQGRLRSAQHLSAGENTRCSSIVPPGTAAPQPDTFPDILNRHTSARQAATASLTLEAKLTGQKEIKALESLRTAKRRELFEAQDRIDVKRGELIQNIESNLRTQMNYGSLLSITWILL